MIGDLAIGNIKTDSILRCEFCRKEDEKVKRFIIYHEGIIDSIERILDSHDTCLQEYFEEQN